MTKIKHSKLFTPKYSIKLQDFIVDKIEGGMTLAEICRNYGPPEHDVVPIEKTCYRWKKKYPAFKKALDEAYQTLMFKMMDEMNDLSKEIRDLDSKWDTLKQQIESEPDLSAKDVDSRCRALTYQIKDKRESAKVRLRSLEFMLTRIAPKMVPELKETTNKQTIELPNITIVNYSDPSKLLSNSISSLTYEKTK